VTGKGGGYLLDGGAAELERLQLQARVWEDAAEAFLDRIGVRPGARCLDLGCGAMGILGPLSRRAGPRGHVVGLDSDAKQLAAARHLVRQEGWANVEIVEGDAYDSRLPPESFDLVHVRFVFAPAGHDELLLREMLALAKPGGGIAIQEPDTQSWHCIPPNAAYERLTQAIRSAFVTGGGDFDVGRRTRQLLSDHGVADVRVRGAVLALHDRHPYMRSPLQFAASLRERILRGGMTATELDDTLAEVTRVIEDPATVVTTFTVTQVWGVKPGRRDG
jgi:SAM-dependent methyltransferase